MNKIYILFLCLCYAVSAIMANTYKNDKEVTSPTDANILGMSWIRRPVNICRE